MKPWKEWMKVMTSADKQPALADVNENIKRMHTCRSREQFQHLGLCEPASSNNGGVVPASEIIAAAHEKLEAKACKKVKGCYYVNSKRAIAEPVTNDWVQDYESSVTGKATVRVQLSI
ncbi:hypothetical protein CYMTET_36382 [Cymbomonas tetramitiformis]|uniref:Uncharacterized protein n=1 Tax=Cymbomonas tetramitiformis TaxID=36881 RepID=A0AAE0CFJ2_9CHLO|nr:hypothetical protein CYMTET_36673 [Cymbomonas tetramitiformis]KAK3254401.1 hypothetical protein CYMTET_36382 [Cymbomonas tetramitiformis]